MSERGEREGGGLDRDGPRSRVLEVVQHRRSVRSFSPRPVENWKLRLVLEALRLAPSSTNSQPWRVVVVKDAGLREALSQAVPMGIRDHSWMAAAQVVLGLCAKPHPVQRVGQVLGKDYHLVDAGIAGEHAVLVAAELGLGTCWVGWFAKRATKRLLGVPRFVQVVCLIPMGYPAGDEGKPSARVTANQLKFLLESPPEGIGRIPAKGRKPLDEVCFLDRFGRPFPPDFFDAPLA
ncbi:MAG: hypothetical protein Kow0069_30560 [Promethearchaeota archaeon]